MASFVSGGGGGSKYENVIKSAVESNGIGWLGDYRSPAIPLTTISNFGEDTDDDVADISSIAQTYADQIYPGSVYEVILDGVKYVSEIKVDVNGNVSRLIIYPYNQVNGSPIASITTYRNDYSVYLWKENATDNTSVTLQVDFIGMPNKIQPMFLTANTYIAEYGVTGFYDIFGAYNEGKNILVKSERYKESNSVYPEPYYQLCRVNFRNNTDTVPSQFVFCFFNYYSAYDYHSINYITLDYSEGWSSNIEDSPVMWDSCNSLKNWYGTCSTASQTTAKVVNCYDFSLYIGVTIDVKFTYAHDASSATLNVNSTGAKTVTGATSGAWNAGDVVKFTYDGTNWNIVEGKRWNGVSLDNSVASMSNTTARIPFMWDLNNEKSARMMIASKSPSVNSLAIYDSSAYLNSTTPTSGDDSTKVATTAFVQDALDSFDALPSQTGNSGKFLTTNGTAASWTNAPTELFKCTYGTTTYSEITTVINYKLPYLQKGRKCYIYSGSIGDGNYETLCFDNVSNGILSRITCSDMNVWTELTAITVVPNTRTVNSKALSSDITLTASDVGALPSSTTIPAQISKIYTGTCTTDYLTAAKVVTLDEATGFSLVDGRKVLVTFTNGNNYQGTATVNVNNTGAYTLCAPAGINSYIDNNYLSANFITQGESILLTYKSGTGWIQTTSASLTTSQSIILADKQKVITVSTSEPTSADGVDGDIWFVYEE